MPEMQGGRGEGSWCRDGPPALRPPPRPAGLTAILPHADWSPSPRNRAHSLSSHSSLGKTDAGISQSGRRRRSRGHCRPVAAHLPVPLHLSQVAAEPRAAGKVCASTAEDRDAGSHGTD